MIESPSHQLESIVMDFEDRIRRGDFTNKILYPVKPRKPIVVSTANPADFRKHADALEEYELLLAKWRILTNEYNQAENAVYLNFKQALLEELDVSNHKNAQKLFDMAWERQHGSGLESVYWEARELAELLV